MPLQLVFFLVLNFSLNDIVCPRSLVLFSYTEFLYKNGQDILDNQYDFVRRCQSVIKNPYLIYENTTIRNLVMVNIYDFNNI